MGRQLTLFGSCSSDSMPRRKDFKIIMNVRCTGGQRTETRVYKKSFEGEYILANVLSFYPPDPDSETYSESESESELDLSFESWSSELVDSDSNFSAGLASIESD